MLLIQQYKTYKNFECEFWLNFYKEFHIVNRDNGKEYFEELTKHFNTLFNLVNGYEDLYLPMKNLDKTHIWIIWAMRNLLNEFTENADLQFDKNLMLKPDVYEKLNQEFNFFYWENIKK